MSDSDPHASAKISDKKPLQFSIAFLLWLTMVCAFVLGIAIWTPCFFNPVLAVAIATILTIAYRKGKQAIWCSLIFGAATTAIACGDRIIDVATHYTDLTDHAISVFEALFFAIIGLAGGLGLATLPSNRERMSLPNNAEQRSSQVSHDA